MSYEEAVYDALRRVDIYLAVYTLIRKEYARATEEWIAEWMNEADSPGRDVIGRHMNLAGEAEREILGVMLGEAGAAAGEVAEWLGDLGTPADRVVIGVDPYDHAPIRTPVGMVTFRFDPDCEIGWWDFLREKPVPSDKVVVTLTGAEDMGPLVHPTPAELENGFALIAADLDAALKGGAE